MTFLPSARALTLLSLPAELRLIILRYLVQSDIEISHQCQYLHTRKIVQSHQEALDLLKRDVVSPYSINKDFTLHSEVLRTCKQLYIEGTDLLYTNKTAAINYVYIASRGKVKNKSLVSVMGEKSVEAAIRK